MKLKEQFQNAYRAFRSRSKQYNSNWKDYRSLYVYSGVITATVLLTLVRAFADILLYFGGIPYLSTSTLPLLQKSIWVLIPLVLLVFLVFYLAYFQYSVILLGVRDIHADRYSLLNILGKTLKATVHASPLTVLLLALNIGMVLPVAAAMYPTDIISSIRIPDYIADYMIARWYLAILLAVLVFGIYWLALRYYLVIPLTILKGFPTRKAFSISASMMKGHKRKTMIQLIVLSLLFFITQFLVFVPAQLIQQFADFIGGTTAPVVCLVLLTLLKLFVAYYSIRISIIMLLSTLPEEMFETEGFNESSENRTIRKKTNKVLSILSAVGMVLFAVGYSSFTIFTFDYNEPMVISNSGVDGDNGIPNTVSVMQRTALSASPDYTSVTIQQTKDGVFVVVGLDDLHNYCQTEQKAWELTLEELTALPAVKGTYTDYYSSLDDYLEAAANIGQCLILELPASCFNSPETVRSLINIYGGRILMEGHILQSSNYDTVKELLNINEEIVEQTGLYSITFPISCSLYNAYLYPSVNTNAFTVENGNLQQLFVDKGKIFSQEIYVWNADTENEMDRMILMNVDGIYTYYPSLLRKRIDFLSTNGYTAIIEKFIYKFYYN